MAETPPAGPDLAQGVTLSGFTCETLLGHVSDQDVLLVPPAPRFWPSTRIELNFGKALGSLRRKSSRVSRGNNESQGSKHQKGKKNALDQRARQREITVKIHRGAAMRKMGARILADLVRMGDVLKPKGG